ncbi:unnamed protein product [Rotaria sp. Silwood2]|nr:unnamed protein product [Rotaria sp. Silwood2]CAF2924135.1 unnamed protein product [Rotaria sp. Silwood2]CAF3257096.1 unnamed protein product [Rotaria sp. Silwood2]CAF4412861.1 unnamed protein product [Rotaria sp. Silwood2]CAF4425415.1 unnamed protein product [Rotaria sp. Silwood2]
MGIAANQSKHVLSYGWIGRYKKERCQSTENEEDNPLVRGIMKFFSIVYPSEVTYNRLAIEYLKKGYYDLALAKFEQLLTIQIQRCGDEQNVDVASTYHKFGHVYEMKKDYDLAMFYYKMSIEIRERLCNSNEQRLDLAESYKGIANVHHHYNEYEVALTFDKKALKIYLEIMPKDDFNTAKLYHRIGIIYEELKEYETAFENYGKAFELYKIIYSFKYGRYSGIHHNLLMRDINRRLLRMLSIVKKADADLEQLNKYYRMFNKDQEEERIMLKGEVASWQIDDITR